VSDQKISNKQNLIGVSTNFYNLSVKVFAYQGILVSLVCSWNRIQS